MSGRLRTTALSIALMLSSAVFAYSQNAGLIEAAKQGNSESVSKLLAKGADVNAKDAGGRPVLMEAAM
jgi:ankyrin repeat protein